MKLAVRKGPGYIPGSGFHYMMHPMAMESDTQAAVFEQMGHIIIEVDALTGERLLNEGCAALRHQIEVAYIAEQQLKARALERL